MTAYDAFTEILDINETIEGIKKKNMEKEPDRHLCKSVTLLCNYREILAEALRSTELKFDKQP